MGQTVIYLFEIKEWLSSARLCVPLNSVILYHFVTAIKSYRLLLSSRTGRLCLLRILNNFESMIFKRISCEFSTTYKMEKRTTRLSWNKTTVLILHLENLRYRLQAFSQNSCFCIDNQIKDAVT